MIKIDARALTDAVVKLEAACNALPEIVQTAKDEALGHAVIGANRSVYDTTPGAYQRTQDYLRGFETRGRATRNTASVTVLNRVDYASLIELGTGPHEVTPGQIVERAAANPAAPLYLGRTGRRYDAPGPAAIPAAVYSLYRMGELFAGKVRAVIR